MRKVREGAKRSAPLTDDELLAKGMHLALTFEERLRIAVLRSAKKASTARPMDRSRVGKPRGGKRK